MNDKNKVRIQAICLNTKLNHLSWKLKLTGNSEFIYLINILTLIAAFRKDKGGEAPAASIISPYFCFNISKEMKKCKIPEDVWRGCTIFSL